MAAMVFDAAKVSELAGALQVAQEQHDTLKAQYEEAVKKLTETRAAFLDAIKGQVIPATLAADNRVVVQSGPTDLPEAIETPITALQPGDDVPHVQPKPQPAPGRRPGIFRVQEDGSLTDIKRMAI